MSVAVWHSLWYKQFMHSLWIIIFFHNNTVILMQSIRQVSLWDRFSILYYLPQHTGRTLVVSLPKTFETDAGEQQAGQLWMVYKRHMVFVGCLQTAGICLLQHTSHVLGMPIVVSYGPPKGRLQFTHVLQAACPHTTTAQTCWCTLSALAANHLGFLLTRPGSQGLCRGHLPLQH